MANFSILTDSAYPTVPSPPSQAVSAGFEGALTTLFLVVIGSLLFVGVFYLGWVLCVKDLVLTFKAHRQRRTEEIGFGNTPARVDARGV
uniref:Movement protein n=1 Tax=Rice latent virus 1 TaxID=2012856 RepID=A0A2D0WZD8_9GEMI|nr:movement protein [Rice latent virus 1]